MYHENFYLILVKPLFKLHDQQKEYLSKGMPFMGFFIVCQCLGVAALKINDFENYANCPSNPKKEKL